MSCPPFQERAAAERQFAALREMALRYQAETRRIEQLTREADSRQAAVAASSDIEAGGSSADPGSASVPEEGSAAPSDRLELLDTLLGGLPPERP